jgi:DNA-binding transcriptional regulator YiaG
MNTQACSNCGETAKVVRRNYRFAEMGLPVELMRIRVIECPHCGNIDPVIPNMDGLMHALALTVLSRPSKLNGAEVRFLRKYVNKSAQEFSRFLHVDPTHLSKIENNRLEIGNRTDKLFRLLAVNMDPSLADGIQGLMKLMPDIEDSCVDARKDIQIDPSALAPEYA